MRIIDYEAGLQTVTTEIATIVRIQQSSDEIQRSVVMEVAGFLEPQLTA